MARGPTSTARRPARSGSPHRDSLGCPAPSMRGSLARRTEVFMRIGILEIVSLPARSISESAVRVILTKQFAAIMPQAVSAWCRQLGHQTYYATYYGIGDPYQLLPH